jgi:peptide/nickel transport system permease protein
MTRPLVLAGAAILLLFAAVSALASWLAPHDPGALDLDGALDGPSRSHPLGQDRLGRDVLARLLFGGRVSLTVGIAVVALSMTIGVTLGSLAGTIGGAVDAVLMRAVDVLLSFPGILLVIAVAGVLGPSARNVVFALAVLGWTGFARLVRGQVLSLREREFVLAARAIGAGRARIIVRHLLPNLIGPVIVQATFGIAGVILAESSLSFLGLGPQDVPTWGKMLQEGTDYLLFAPHLSIFPGLAIALTVLAFNFLGDGLRDRLDPKTR